MKNLYLDCSILKRFHKKFYSFQDVQPLLNPKLVSVNRSLASQLGFHTKDLDSKDFIKFINGEYILQGSTPYAYAYSGHQFGYFTPDLGDGRALNLGKLENYHLQLKGSGTTPYSRQGDGRAVLRSSIREYLASEAMFGLGIPTSRAIGIITSDTKVFREYEDENCAIVLRASTSWKRFGSFEFAYLSKDKKEKLKNIADFVIEENFPNLKGKNDRYEQLYFSIVDRTVELVAKWQSVGFMHGVLNTDNMSIEGLTIDYGPYAFMEEFDRKFICNLSDDEGRYSFENQPYITHWNLSKLAKVFSPIADQKLLESYSESFMKKFHKRYFELMGEKLGLFEFNYQKDKSLISSLLKAMQDDRIDYTSFFYLISKNLEDIDMTPHIANWFSTYKKRLESESISHSERSDKMLKVNPKYILRNYMLQDAIELAQKGDFTLVNDLLDMVHNPYSDFPEFEHYTKPKQEFTILRCSCSS